MSAFQSLEFDNRYARLDAVFYDRVRPTPFEKPPYLVHVNSAMASVLGLDPEQVPPEAWEKTFTGEAGLPGSDPVAMRYAGHQFGHYVPQLGDGRAILLGQVRTPSGESIDLHLKGAGLTAYSRDGDGRAVLRSSIREYLCGEAMHGLGIPTTRALCLIGSEEEVYREKIEPGAMLVRTAPSHVRFGSFELFFYRNEHEFLKPLADHVIAEHFPELVESGNPYMDFLNIVIDRTAILMAQWQSVGFCHGVMNTDNMSVLGLTLDYGPFGFMEVYNPGHICNHSDYHGRYAYNQQPQIGLWNLTRFAQALLPLLHEDPQAGAELANDALRRYEEIFTNTYLQLFSQKLGLVAGQEDDMDLLKNLLDSMVGNQVDFTIFFRRLCNFDSSLKNNRDIRDLFVNRSSFDQWAKDYAARLKRENSDDDERAGRMKKINPCYVLRNYMAQAAIEKAEKGDFGEIDVLMNLLQNPFEEKPGHERYAEPPPEWADDIAVSCSS